MKEELDIHFKKLFKNDLEFAYFYEQQKSDLEIKISTCDSVFYIENMDYIDKNIDEHRF